jgi:anionic cell wall polymer biosynthesis LytR-Cps2A-Psr (LCP) family protein
MATVIGIMDRDGWRGRTDNIVVVDPSSRRMTWVPRDLWCDQLKRRINSAYRLGGHAGIIGALGKHGLAVEHSICVRREAVERALEDVTVEVPVREPLRLRYPLWPQDPIEEGHKLVSFEPPTEVLTGERIHQWLGARYGSTDRGRIRRQRDFVASLLRQGFDFGLLLRDPGLVSVSDPKAIDEVRQVQPSWALETLGHVAVATVDGMSVLVRPAVQT